MENVVAEAAAEPIGAPIPSDTVNTPQPLGSQIPEAEQKAEARPEPSKSAGDAVQKAQAALQAKAEGKPNEKVTPQPKPEGKAEPRVRADDGKFAGREPSPPAAEPKPAAQAADAPHREAPARFSNDAKAAWNTAPEPIKAEVHRALRELEDGHQKYKADAEAYSEVKHYADMARQYGTSVKDALDRYTGLEQRLSSSDPNIKVQAVAEVLEYAGVSPQQYAAYITGQSPDQAHNDQFQTISQLKQEIAGLKQQFGGVSQTIEEQKRLEVQSRLDAFAQSRPRLDELSADMSFFIQSGRAQTLDEAYDLAERLNPGPSPVAQAPQAPPPVSQPAPLNPAGRKSIQGAPATGSDPAARKKPVPSINAALQDAVRKAGLKG